ncbi:MAG: PDZ domain-containing protein [Acidimicrobiia bacterium]|nr:PDZ domain-containing protein [Acidimicrobiia bacterium]
MGKVGLGALSRYRFHVRKPQTLFLAGVLLLAACAGQGGETTTSSASTTSVAAVATEPDSTSPSIPTTTPETSGPDTTATPNTTATPDTTTATTTANPEFPTCDEDPGNSEVLCSTVGLIEEYYVDQVRVEELATSAIASLDDANIPAPDEEDETCSVPTEDFAAVCELAVENDWDVDKTSAQATTDMIRRTLDPNSAYIDPETTELFREVQQGSIEGIGALVTTRNESEQVCDPIGDGCRMIIVTPFEGGPAAEAGLQPDDEIFTVNGDDIAGRSIDEVTAVVRGPEGTMVTLGVRRDSEEFTIDIERAAVEVPVVESDIINGVGYLRLNQFTANAGDQVRTALEKFGSVDSMILDLRNNPGGLLDAAIEVTSEFTDSGGVVEIESRDGMESYEVTPGGLATDRDVPLYVLVNEGSASASEVLAGALGESGRAVVVGENSFGKNTVQQQFPLPNDGTLKLTIARWHTPGGLDFGENGITPDVELALDPAATPQELVDQTLAAVG